MRYSTRKACQHLLYAILMLGLSGHAAADQAVITEVGITLGDPAIPEDGMLIISGEALQARGRTNPPHVRLGETIVIARCRKFGDTQQARTAQRSN